MLPPGLFLDPSGTPLGHPARPLSPPPTPPPSSSPSSSSSASSLGVFIGIPTAIAIPALDGSALPPRVRFIPTIHEYDRSTVPPYHLLLAGTRIVHPRRSPSSSFFPPRSRPALSFHAHSRLFSALLSARAEVETEVQIETERRQGWGSKGERGRHICGIPVRGEEARGSEKDGTFHSIRAQYEEPLFRASPQSRLKPLKSTAY